MAAKKAPKKKASKPKKKMAPKKKTATKKAVKKVAKKAPKKKESTEARRKRLKKYVGADIGTLRDLKRKELITILSVAGYEGSIFALGATENIVKAIRKIATSKSRKKAGPAKKAPKKTAKKKAAKK